MFITGDSGLGGGELSLFDTGVFIPLSASSSSSAPLLLLLRRCVGEF